MCARGKYAPTQRSEQKTILECGFRISDCGIERQEWSVVSLQLSVVSFQMSPMCLAATRRGARENLGLWIAEIDSRTTIHDSRTTLHPQLPSSIARSLALILPLPSRSAGQSAGSGHGPQEPRRIARSKAPTLPLQSRSAGAQSHSGIAGGLARFCVVRGDRRQITNCDLFSFNR